MVPREYTGTLQRQPALLRTPHVPNTRILNVSIVAKICKGTKVNNHRTIPTAIQTDHYISIVDVEHRIWEKGDHRAPAASLA